MAISGNMFFVLVTEFQLARNVIPAREKREMICQNTNEYIYIQGKMNISYASLEKLSSQWQLQRRAYKVFYLISS